MNRTRPAWTFAVVVIASLVLTAVSVDADVILSTDFAGRTVSGDTAGNITWIADGVLAPGDLTAVDINNAAPAPFVLFDTASVQGHFAPNLNTGNEGPWSTSLILNLTVPEISLENVVLDYQHFDNNGGFQGVNRLVNWTVTVTGSISGQLDSVQVIGVANKSGTETVVFAAPLELTSDESYTVVIRADGGNTTGNNTGLDGVTFNGIATPEPATVSLLALGGLALLRRRRY